MAKKIIPLTDVQIRKAKPSLKPYKLSDGGGLYLLVMESGGKSWRLKFKFEGKEDTLTLGMYPDVPLATARALREEARQLLASGINPKAVKKQAKEAQIKKEASVFEKVAECWFEYSANESNAPWAASHARTIRLRLDRYLIPFFRGMNIAEIRPTHIKPLLLKLEKDGKTETAKRVNIIISQIARYAILHDWAEYDPTASYKIGDVITMKPTEHFAAITDPKELAPLLRDVDNYWGKPETRAALQLLPMFLLRPGNLTHLEWAKVDFDEKQIVFPLKEMKQKTTDHIVPLAHQAIEILKELQPFTGHGKYLFPCVRSATRTMSENTLNAAFRRMGYGKDEVTAHGFRATAKTILAERLKVPDSWVEHQLHHAVKDTNGRAYNRATFIDDRRKIMQDWADYLERLKSCETAKVIPLHRAA